jgi:hypothetical protein
VEPRSLFRKPLELLRITAGVGAFIFKGAQKEEWHRAGEALNYVHLLPLKKQQAASSKQQAASSKTKVSV